MGLLKLPYLPLLTVCYDELFYLIEYSFPDEDTMNDEDYENQSCDVSYSTSQSENANDCDFPSSWADNDIHNSIPIIHLIKQLLRYFSIILTCII